MISISAAVAFGPAIEMARSPDKRVSTKLTTSTVRHTSAARHSLRKKTQHGAAYCAKKISRKVPIPAGRAQSPRRKTRGRRCNCTVSIGRGCAPTASDPAEQPAATARLPRMPAKRHASAPTRSKGAPACQIHSSARVHTMPVATFALTQQEQIAVPAPREHPPEHHAKSRDSGRLQDAASTPALRSPPPPMRRHRAGRSTSLSSEVSFFALKSAKVATSGARRNGLAASSLAIVDGTVGCPPRADDALPRCAPSGPHCSIDAQRKARIAFGVFVAAADTVAPGNAASLRSEANISSAVPSISRPHPRLNSVSPDSSISPSLKK